MNKIAVLGDESMRMYDWWLVTASKVFCDSFKRAQTRIGAIDHQSRLHDYADYRLHGSRLLKYLSRR